MDMNEYGNKSIVKMIKTLWFCGWIENHWLLRCFQHRGWYNSICLLLTNYAMLNKWKMTTANENYPEQITSENCATIYKKRDSTNRWYWILKWINFMFTVRTQKYFVHFLVWLIEAAKQKKNPLNKAYHSFSGKCMTLNRIKFHTSVIRVRCIDAKELAHYKCKHYIAFIF